MRTSFFLLRAFPRRISAVALLLALAITTAWAASGTIERGSFRFHFGRKGVTGIANPADPFGAVVTSPKVSLGLLVSYQNREGGWVEIKPKAASVRRIANDVVVVEQGGMKDPLKVVQTFKTDGRALDWVIELQATTADAVTIGDLAIRIPEVHPDGEEPHRIFERSFVRHQFISGNGSFLFFVRASGVSPFLVATVLPGTKLEYFTLSRQGVLDFVHSGFSGPQEKHGTWRQEHTFLKLSGTGKDGSSVRYGFRFRWAASYEQMRQVLYEEGLFDARFVPGMVIPLDLKAKFSLRTRARIDSIESEFPDQTRINKLEEREDGHRIYEVKFRRLGENKLTIHHDSGRATYLEFFVTEPIETLIKKRSSFIIQRQQVRDPSKWWDGVFAPYDMRTGVLRTPADPDIFTGRMSYVLTCDDPGLSKAPFVAEKNVSFPDAEEIRGLEYYLQHFVWGKLQRTDQEQPYPYGVYGTPDWYTNRDPERRRRITHKNLDKMHVWRSYDYPHMVRLYYHMYEIAKKYPDLSSYVDAPGYLERAWQTAHAFYIYPYQIFPSYYETYKWGLYNELVVLNLADALDKEGFPDRAAWLRSEWEKKVKYFVYDDPYPYRSEYAFDRTAYESSYAFAKYGSTHDMKPDEHLWWDIKLKRWYSHPVVRRQDSRDFMERQLAAGLAVRGWIESSYYQLGADHGLSYMAAMGGWGVLDYGLNFSERPYNWLQLGYASYLSSWSLMNTGPAQSGFGYWFPGNEKDGAAGWEFMPAKYGYAWMGTEVPRGPWFYDGEIDLGYGGALRMASTILTKDPVFGWVAYGGVLTEDGDNLWITPRDGLRQRFAAIVEDVSGHDPEPRRLKIELDGDGFAANQPILANKQLNRIAFNVENRSSRRHTTTIRMATPSGLRYELRHNGNPVDSRETGAPDYPLEFTLTVEAANHIEIVRASGPANP
ncbi:MAG TPA: DUF5695 domain-containing protein [Terriglobales bacterium]|nr:DUF5695 domain-containing protein [Terriglobales bacterium]